jgi:Zn-dependent M16 (insulinase) family peptidase
MLRLKRRLFARGCNQKILAHFHKSAQVGDSFHNFRLEKKELCPDFNVEAFHFEHTITKSKFLHLNCADQNNCLAIIFKTIPDTSKGTPHILEHLTLCGSK